MMFEPDRFASLSRDDKARSAPLFIFAPYWQIGFRRHLAHQLARDKACANFRCGSLVQPLRDYRRPIISRRRLREHDELRIGKFCHIRLLELATASAVTSTTPPWLDSPAGFGSGPPLAAPANTHRNAPFRHEVQSHHWGRPREVLGRTWPRLRPLTAKTGVRVPLGAPGKTSTYPRASKAKVLSDRIRTAVDHGAVDR